VIPCGFPQQPTTSLSTPPGTCSAAERAAAEPPTLQRYGGGVAVVQVPVAAYVEKVYEEGDFSPLGIGT